MVKKDEIRDEALRNYIEICAIELTEKNLKSKSMTSFDDLLKYALTKRASTLRVIKDDLSFYIKLSTIIKDANKAVAKLRGVQYKFLRESYRLDKLPDEIYNNERFRDLVINWNSGERNKTRLAEMSNISRQTLYEWLRKLAELN